MTNEPLTLEGAICPVPLTHNEQIVMGGNII